MPTVMPIFPLNTVVFPGQQLPLHIFEPRYLRLVADVMRDEGEFGIALIESGREVGGGAVPREVGCAVRITELQEAPGGRYNVICSGTRRYRIVQALEEAPYLRAEVEFLPPPTDAGDEEAAELAVGRGGRCSRTTWGSRWRWRAAGSGGCARRPTRCAWPTPWRPASRRRPSRSRPSWKRRGCRPAWRSGCGCWKWRISRCGSSWRSGVGSSSTALGARN